MKLWLLAVALLALVGCSGGDGDADLTLTLSSEGQVVTVTLTNTSSEPIRVVRPTVTPNFVVFIVTDADEAELPYIGFYRELRPLDENGFASLEPGDETGARFDLELLFPLEAGDYTVRAEYRNPELGSHEGTSAVVLEPGKGIVSDPIKVTIP